MAPARVSGRKQSAQIRTSYPALSRAGVETRCRSWSNGSAATNMGFLRLAALPSRKPLPCFRRAYSTVLGSPCRLDGSSDWYRRLNTARFAPRARRPIGHGDLPAVPTPRSIKRQEQVTSTLAVRDIRSQLLMMTTLAPPLNINVVVRLPVPGADPPVIIPDMGVCPAGQVIPSFVSSGLIDL